MSNEQMRALQANVKIRFAVYKIATIVEIPRSVILTPVDKAIFETEVQAEKFVFENVGKDDFGSMVIIKAYSKELE